MEAAQNGTRDPGVRARFLPLDQIITFFNQFYLLFYGLFSSLLFATKDHRDDPISAFSFTARNCCAVKIQMQEIKDLKKKNCLFNFFKICLISNTGFLFLQVEDSNQCLFWLKLSKLDST